MPGSGASKGTERIEAFGLKPANYIMVAARLVPEKRQLDLIKAYARMSNPGGIQLAVVGGSDHPDEYEKKVRIEADKTPGVVMTGFQSGEALSELFANARLFVLPSSHEGMPIALLEALGYGLPVLASDIVPNKEIGLCQRTISGRRHQRIDQGSGTEVGRSNERRNQTGTNRAVPSNVRMGHSS